MNLYTHYLFYTFLLVSIVSSEYEPPSLFTDNGKTYLDDNKEVILHNGQVLRTTFRRGPPILLGAKKFIFLSPDGRTELKDNKFKFEVQEQMVLQKLQDNLMLEKNELFEKLKTDLDSVYDQMKQENHLVHSQLDEQNIENQLDAESSSDKSNDHPK